MKKILVPTDFSDNATDALAYAINFATATQTHIHIVHVIDSNVSSADLPLINSEIIQANMERSKNEMEGVKVFCKNLVQNKESIKFTHRTVVGSIPYLIKKEAEKEETDMIIMGTRGEKYNLIDKIFGAAAFAVIDDAPCPVILVPHNYKYETIDSAIFATGLSHSDPYDLWKASQLLLPHSLIIRCIYVTKKRSEEDQSEIERFAQYMVEHSPSIQTMFHIEEGDQIDSILQEYSENFDAKMLIMHRSKKTLWNRLFSDRQTKKMAQVAQIPLLIMNE